MSKLRRKFIILLSVLLCAMLCLSAALIIPKNKTAEAASGTTLEIYNDNYASNNKNPFSAQKLRELYIKITNNPNANFSSIKNLVAGGDVTSKTIRDNNGSNLSVMFGGLKWDVVYLTKALDTLDSDNDGVGDVILDLWLSSDTTLTTSKWANSSDGTTDGYPSNMYSTSYIRVETLNAGGYAADSSRNISSKTDPKANHYFARFTVANPTNGESVIDYIVQPKDVAYQADEYSKTGMGGSGSDVQTANNAPNDAYVSPALGDFYYKDSNHNYDYTGKPHYGDWKEDYLWLPSLAEAGRNEGASTVCGIWKTDSNLRSSGAVAKAWTRSAMLDIASQARCVKSDGGGIDVTTTDTSTGVRPALHLNLTKAEMAAKGVSYDNTDATNVEQGATINYRDPDGHIFSHVYDGDDVEIELLERAKLKPVNPSDYTTGASYNSIGGKFIAKYPEQQPDANGNGDKTYEISVQPQTGYVWDDSDTSEARTYKIKISLADITVGWQGFNAALGDNLLRPNSEITVKGNTADSPLEVRYYIVEPNTTNSPPTNTADWTERGTATEPTVEKAGTYHVYYEIKANYHKPVKSSYSVSVGVENVKIQSNGSIGNAIYSEGDTVNLTDQSWLISKIKNAISVTKDGQPYDSVDTLLGNLEVVVSNKTGNSYTKADTNSHERYNAGTYYLDLKFKDNANQSVQFTWANGDRPTFTVEKLPITVEVIPATDGGTLTHVYGDSTVAAMKYKLVSAPADGEDVDDVITGGFIRKDNNTALGSTTPAGKYEIVGEVDENGNYDITFKKSVYEVTKRHITIKIEDEEVEYGTDLSSYTFEFTTDDALARGETLEKVILSENVNYTLYLNGNEVSLSNTHYIGVYELTATVTADNYTFTVTAGKITITKANFDMSGVKLENAGHIYNGEPHPAKLNGTLPSDEITVSYRYVNYNTGEELDGPPTEVGLYIVYASFSHDNSNYNPIIDKAAYIRIAYTQEELNQAFPSLPTDEELAAAADLAKKKTEAKQTLDEEAKKKKDEIDANEELTDEEKAEAKKKVDEELARGNAAIDGATDINGVNQAYNDGKANIEKIKGEHKEESSFPWWIIAVIAGVLVVLAVIIVIVVKRRNSEDDEEDFYDDEYDFDDEEVEEEDDFGDFE